MSVKVYAYKNCDTCRKAAKWLVAQGIAFKEVPIRETPPTVAELRTRAGRRGAGSVPGRRGAVGDKPRGGNPVHFRYEANGAFSKASLPAFSHSGKVHS